MNGVIAIDPGNEETALIAWNGAPIQMHMLPNASIMELIRNGPLPLLPVKIEMIACYGMAVGKTVFETCRFIGRLQEAFDSRGYDVSFAYRKDIKLHLCGTSKAKDANVSQALKDKYGEVGTKNNPGPLYGIKGDLWAALAVADYALTAEKQLF